MEDQVFGKRYRVTEPIGSGGMAEVFKAVDEVLGRTVAVKVLHPRYASDPTFVARFRQEAQAAANLSNPHIVNIYDWGQDDSTYYIVMEYVRGTDLKSIVEVKGALDPMKAADYASQACSALAVAHGYDIVHRDIKPHNIVLTPDGQIKVMDFGIARAGNTTMTQTGSVLGTAQYISPEQAQGRPLGPSSDLYSLGVVLYELTTGKLPFEGETPVAVALKQVNEQAVPPRQVNPNIPPALEAVIMKAMEKDPADRYASADEMRADLRKVIAGQPVAAAAAGAAAAAASQTTVLPTVAGASAAQPARRAAQPPQKRPVWPWIVIATLLLLLGMGGLWASGILTPKVEVPRVTGLRVQEASATIAAKGLHVASVTTRNDDAMDAGLVVDQNPRPLDVVPQGSGVDLVVSAGPSLVAIPKVIGMKESDAFNAIQSAGLQITTETTFSTKPEGIVVGQNPGGGVKVRKSTRVLIVVSQGVEKTEVPDVLRHTRSEAIRLIELRGLAASVDQTYSADVAKGAVISQKPGAGASVPKGSTVTIVLSRGPRTFTMPNVIGKLWTDARATLEGDPYNFAVTLVGGTPSATATVSAQNPPQGTQLRKGASVSITAP